MSRFWKRNERFIQFLKQQAENGRCSLLIVTHDNPDPDCLASALALRRIGEEILGKAPVIGYGGVVGRSENRAMVRKLRIPMSPVVELNLENFDLIALVDTQPKTGNNSLPHDIVPNIVIDHHPPRTKNLKNVDWVDIRIPIGATSTILYEYLQAAGIELDRRLANAIFYAIKSETQDLGREGVAADRRAYFATLRMVDPNTIFDIVYAPVPREYFRMLSQGLQNAKIYEDALVTNLMEIDTADHVAEIADMLLRLSDVNWTFVMGRYQGDLFMSLRTLVRDMDAGMVMRKVVAKMGSGGGHEMIAGGRIPDVGDDPEYLRSLEDALTKIFLRTIRARCRKGDMLVEGEENGNGNGNGDLIPLPPKPAVTPPKRNSAKGEKS